MMSSVIPARLVFQCGHAALVSLPRIKGETNAQRADRVTREKSSAHTRACDFCAQRLEVVVQQAAPVLAPAVVSAPTLPVVTAPTPPVGISPTPPVVAAPTPVEASAPPPVEVSAPPPAEPPAPTVAAPTPLRRPVGRPRKVVAPVTPPVTNGKVTGHAKAAPAARAKVVAKSVIPNGRGPKGGVRYMVEFEVETVLRAADVHDALRRAQALGAVEVLAIIQEH
jgi:hypothetical protein